MAKHRFVYEVEITVEIEADTHEEAKAEAKRRSEEETIYDILEEEKGVIIKYISPRGGCR